MIDEKLYEHISGGFVAVSTSRKYGICSLTYVQRPMRISFMSKREKDIELDQDGRIALIFPPNSSFDLMEEPSDALKRAKLREIYYYYLINRFEGAKA